MKQQFDPLFLETTRAEYLRLYAIKPREASKYLREVCDKNEVKYKTLQSHLDLNVRKPKETPADVQARQAEMDSFGRIVWQYAQEHSFDSNKMELTVALDCVQCGGQVPKSVCIKQIYRALDRLHLRNDSEPIAKRFERRHAMSLWQIDFSKSRYFKHAGDGEVVLQDPRFTKRQEDGFSLWFGIAIDDASRVMYAEYFAAKGESADVVIDFTLHAFDAKPGHLHLQGLPKAVYVDRGSGWIDARTRTGLLKLGIEQILGGDEVDSLGRALKRSNKKGRGKVERAVQTIKQTLEARLFGKLQSRRMMLSELNQVVSEWLEEWNQGAHPTRRDEGKMNVFMDVAGKQFENLRFPPDDARALFSRAWMKKVIRRKIQVAKDLWCVAPSFVDDGDDVEILKDQTGWYLFQDGKRHKLQPEGVTIVDEAPKQVEVRTAVLADLQLRKRFDEELQKELGLAMNRLDDDTWNDIAPFFERPRSVEEIEEQVAWLKVRQQNATPSRGSNIIKLPTTNYVRE